MQKYREIYKQVIEKGKPIRKVAKGFELSYNIVSDIIADEIKNIKREPVKQLYKIKSVESELFYLIEQEQKTGEINPAIDSLTFIYSTIQNG